MDAEEYNAQCPDWALNGECHTDPGFMLVNCAKSCGACKGVHGKPNFLDRSQSKLNLFRDRKN